MFLKFLDRGPHRKSAEVTEGPCPLHPHGTRTSPWGPWSRPGHQGPLGPDQVPEALHPAARGRPAPVRAGLLRAPRTVTEAHRGPAGAGKGPRRTGSLRTSGLSLSQKQTRQVLNRTLKFKKILKASDHTLPCRGWGLGWW